MDTAQPEKICVLCGEDCAGRPRIKDPRGRYYHKTCYEETERRLAEKKAASAVAVMSPEASGTGTEAGSLLGELIDEASTAHPPTPCPGCSQPMVPDAVICTNCGYNTQTGQQLAVAAPPIVSAGLPKAVWPLVVGVFSVLFGGGGTLIHGIKTISILQDARGANVIGALVGGGIALLLSIWLLMAGVGIIRRKQHAMESIRKWALVKLIVTVTCFSVFLVALLALGGMSGEIGKQLGPASTALGVGVVAVVVAILFAWALFWPVFILFWFSRASVQEEVRRWQG